MIKVIIKAESDGDFRLTIDTTNLFDCSYKLLENDGDYEWEFSFGNTESIENKIYYLFNEINFKASDKKIYNHFKDKLREYLKNVLNLGPISSDDFFGGNCSFIIQILEVNCIDIHGNKY